MCTRGRSAGNVGLVFSYSGADVDGAWDTERLRYNDFYGALGFKGVDPDSSSRPSISASATTTTRRILEEYESIRNAAR